MGVSLLLIRPFSRNSNELLLRSALKFIEKCVKESASKETTIGILLMFTRESPVQTPVLELSSVAAYARVQHRMFAV